MKKRHFIFQPRLYLNFSSLGMLLASRGPKQRLWIERIMWDSYRLLSEFRGVNACRRLMFLWHWLLAGRRFHSARSIARAECHLVGVWMDGRADWSTSPPHHLTTTLATIYCNTLVFCLAAPTYAIPNGWAPLTFFVTKTWQEKAIKSILTNNFFCHRQDGLIGASFSKLDILIGGKQVRSKWW